MPPEAAASLLAVIQLKGRPSSSRLNAVQRAMT